jgi:hypothetical protein
MIKKLKLLIVCIAAVCLMVNSVYADEQSKTGPTPPSNVQMRDLGEIEGLIMAAPPTSPVVIPGVPNYLWRHGCGPTAVGHVVGYYDGQGYNDLITGDASTQTNDVNQAIASGGDSTNPYFPEQHYEDYAVPEDPGPLQTDDYITQGRNPHANDCIGDFQDTSKSTRNNHYGWSWASDLGPSFVNYVNLRNASYNPSYTQYQWGSTLTWLVLKNEIDNGRPMVFLVDSDGDGSTDHFVAVVGYDAPTNQYGCHDSWDNTQVRWETFQGLGYGAWSIWGGWSFQLGTSGEVTKWEQPPDTTPYGMDVRCDRKGMPRILADDFQCTMTGPITKVRLWGSWKSDIKGQIKKIHLSIHSDDPVGPGGTDPANYYSKPDYLLWSKDINAPNFTESLFMDITPEYEYWWDPTTGLLMPAGDHKIWQYDITIDSNQFIQEGTPSQPIVYWLDAYADINTVPTSAQFGWKTSHMHWNDDAVWSSDNGIIWNEMRYPPGHPYAPDSADLAFAIITGQTEPTEEPKWCQGPDLSENGLDVMASDSDPLILADDFECNKTTKITDITVWGSWKDDYLPYGNPNSVSFTLSIHKDIPANDPCYPHEWSMPGDMLWYKTLAASAVSIEKENINEGWYNPHIYEYYFPGDHVCWKYTFHIDPNEAFCQMGEPNKPVVYWLDVQAHPYDTTARFGWKSSINHWNDDAVFTVGTEPLPAGSWWDELRYPYGHQLYGESIDLAFAIDGNIPCEQPDIDFGDAPDGIAAPGYPTLLANNGARHIIDGITFMGALVDAEGNGQPTVNADGDDLNPPAGPDDEDGVVIPPVLLAGRAAVITVTASVPGMLDAWIDYAADSSWAEAGDQIAASLPLLAGNNVITFPVPLTATLGKTYARFRFSTAGGLPPFGPASNGEVEDYTVNIELPPDPNLKYLQRPDVTENGIDIRFDRTDGILRTLADDFLCTATGKITDVHLWCSWLNNIKGNVQTIHLSIHDDISAPNSPTGYSMPGTLLWQRDVTATNFTESLYYTLPQGYEWWLDPYIPIVNPMGDTQIWRYDIYIPYTAAFRQTGDPNHPKVYWLDAWVTLKPDSPPEAQMGWKTSMDHWNDAAVYDLGGNWINLLYPMGHPHQESNVDMAFAITTMPDCFVGGIAGPGEYAKWVDYSRPDCWCCRKQCRGDADCKKTALKPVMGPDLTVFKAAYNKSKAVVKTIMVGTVPGVCADFDHKDTVMKPVMGPDLTIFKNYYNDPDATVPQCDAAPIITGPYNFWTN